MIVHVLPTYGNKITWPDNVKRARNSWQYSDDFRLLEVPIDSMPRVMDSNTRKLPFVRDLIGIGFNDPCVTSVALTNLDTGIAHLGIETVLKSPDCYGFRRDFLKPIRVSISLEYLRRAGQKSSGIDLVHISREWWESYGHEVPDLVLGCEGWDWVLRFMLEVTLGKDVAGNDRRIEDVIYHEYHGTPRWKVFRDTDPGNLLNRKVCFEWWQSLNSGNKDKVIKIWPELKKMISAKNDLPNQVSSEQVKKIEVGSEVGSVAPKDIVEAILVKQDSAKLPTDIHTPTQESDKATPHEELGPSAVEGGQT